MRLCTRQEECRDGLGSPPPSTRMQSQVGGWDVEVTPGPAPARGTCSAASCSVWISPPVARRVETRSFQTILQGVQEFTEGLRASLAVPRSEAPLL